ncbi:MAG: hypothetical protein KC713_03585 [Candidatus Omnitrophica bacterium]|nr:hypothetical protein [Candidatus Omnitrophota bacterium]
MTLKRVFFFVISIFLLSFTHASANADKTFLLTDGTQIKGTIISFDNGEYTIYSDTLGEVIIEDKDVVSVQSPQAMKQQQGRPENTVSLTNMNGLNAGGGAMNNMAMQQKVQQLQSQVMSDPEMISEIQSLAQDEEFIRLLSDPEFMKKIMNFNVEELQNDPKMQQIMQNPKIQTLIQQLNPNQ